LRPSQSGWKAKARERGTDGGAPETAARAQEMRVAARLVRGEAAAVDARERAAPTRMVAENLSLEAQG
jgi:hypothetical protein